MQQDIAVDSTSVYWTDAGAADSINKVVTNGGTVTTLASRAGKLLFSSPHGIAVDSTNVYWANLVGSSIAKVGIIGGTATILAAVA